MHISPELLRYLAGDRAISGPLRRAADRENERHAAQPSVPRPRVYPKDEDPFYVLDKQRLKRLKNRPCPRCGKPLEFTGIILICPRSHGWSNPTVAEDEIGLAGSQEGTP